MAEVKTYKCDICGKVYHVDDNDEKVMTINYKFDSETEDKYEHICDECKYTIHTLIVEPDYIKKLKEDLGKNLELKHKFKSCLQEIYKVIYPDYWRFGMFEFYNDNFTDERTKEIIEAYEELETSRCIWRLVASAGIGVIIGNIIALLLKLFV